MKPKHFSIFYYFQISIFATKRASIRNRNALDALCNRDTQFGTDTKFGARNIEMSFENANVCTICECEMWMLVLYKYMCVNSVSIRHNEHNINEKLLFIRCRTKIVGSHHDFTFENSFHFWICFNIHSCDMCRKPYFQLWALHACYTHIIWTMATIYGL